MEDYVEEEFARVPIDDDEGSDLEMMDVNHAIDDDDILDFQPNPSAPTQAAEGTSISYVSNTSTRHKDRQYQRLGEKKFVIAVDFGTTFSSVAFACFDTDTDVRLINSQSIKCIDNYPDMPPSGPAIVLANNPATPTELLCYNPKGQLTNEDEVVADMSDRESVCSMDSTWAPVTPEEPDHGQDEHFHEVRETAVKSSAWGWGVHSRLIRPENLPKHFKHLKNFKLQLDVSSNTENLRKDSIKEMKKLKGVKTVDIIGEYLYELLKHTKARLAALHGLTNDSIVELVLCVPTSWTDKACRVMQEALNTAVLGSGLVRLEDGVNRDLFIVAESEAAAAYPNATACGSSFLNSNFKKMLKDRLDFADIEGNEISLDTIIATKVQEFEDRKKSINILDKRAAFEPFFVHGLQADSDHGFRKNRLDVTWKEMYDVFKPCISGVADLMKDQLNQAKRSGVNVQTVILVGGFGESPSLKNHLERVLRKERNLVNQSIELIRPNYVESAVARGAVLRALRKENGPQRYIRSSYGVLRSIPYDHSNLKHRRFRVERSATDGELYVTHTIHWILEKVRLPIHQISTVVP